MNAKAIVVTSGKGGVGKTTTTANVATALALRGERVCVIDGDIGLRNLDVVMGLETDVVYDLIDVVERRTQLTKALVPDPRVAGLWMLAAAQNRDKTALSERAMEKVVRTLLEKKGFDRVLIDSPAGIEGGFQVSSAPADGALVVVNPEVSSVRDADRIIGLLHERGIVDVRLIVNRLRPKLVKRGDMLNVTDVLEILGIPLIGIIPEDDEVLISTSTGQPTALAEKRTRASAARAFHDIAGRLMGADLAYPDLLRANGTIAGLKRFLGGE